MQMRARHIVILALAGSLLASCSAVDKLRPRKGVFFDGHQFRARAEQVGEEREDFAVTVHRASQSAKGAAAAGAHQAVTYCIKNFGRSDLTWDAGLGPDDEKTVAARIQDDQITFRGRCAGWP